MNDKPLTLDEVSALTAWSVAALRSRLNRGELSGVKVSKGQRQVWALLPKVVESLKNESDHSSSEYDQVVKRWIQEQELGLNRPEPLSSTTIARRKYGLLAFWDYLDGVKPCDTNNLELIERRRLKMSKGKTLARVTTENIAIAISSVPVENSATRHNIYDTMLSFYQSLIEKGHRTEVEI